MKHSLTYYITLSIIRIKGVKKNFSRHPIDFKKIRKEDIHQPKDNFLKKHTLHASKISDSTITEVGIDKESKHLLIFIHGGAFISGPAKHHWETLKQIAKKTKYKIWMCDYPKAPENQIQGISQNLDAIYAFAITKYQPENIVMLGDSVGATLTAALIQRLILNKQKVPAKAILISPVMDASMSNPEIEAYEQRDVMLSRPGVLSAKKMCAGKIDLKDQIISPLYGNFKGFPNTLLFLAQNDIMYPDGKVAELKMQEANVNLEVFEGNGMPHIWPLLPVMQEAKDSLKTIIQKLS